MAHEITQHADGTAEAAFSLMPAWHGLGVTLDHMMSVDEAMIAAGLNWEVRQQPVAVGFPQHETEAGEIVTARWLYSEQKSYRANVRSDNGTVLGIVSDAYKVVQNAEAFAFLDALQAEREIEIEAAFSLNGGKQVVVCARNPTVDHVTDDDALKRYLVIGLHHDGGGAVKFGPTSVRVVCANTYAMAREQGGVKPLSIRHTGKIDDKLAEARAMIAEANREFETFAFQARALAGHRMERWQWNDYLNVLCPVPSRIDPEWTERRADKIRATRQAIEDAYRNPRQSLPGIAETAWAAFNAVTEYCDHLPRIGANRERRNEARFNVALYGAGRDQKRRAFLAACRIAGVSIA